jgi:hypothetical protein
MKNAPPVTAVRDADDRTLRAVAPEPCFEIVDLRRVEFGSKTAQLAITTAIGTIDVDLFEPPGREAFVQPRSVRAKYDGKWHRTVRFDREFAERVRDAVLAQLESQGPQKASD